MSQPTARPLVHAIIPARAGSKGIPDKNLKPVAGVPLVVRTIQAAQAAARVHAVSVSTDGDAIAAAARTAGAAVIERPAEISGDAAGSEAALLHALDLWAAAGTLPDILVFLQCTSPLTTPAHIDGTVALVTEGGADTALAVAPFHYFLWAPDATGDWQGINHDRAVRLLRQQREPQYIETGSVYVMRVAGFLEHRHRFFGRVAAHVIGHDEVWEIDDPVDLDIAQMLVTRRGG